MKREGKKKGHSLEKKNGQVVVGRGQPKALLNRGLHYAAKKARPTIEVKVLGTGRSTGVWG